MDLFGYIYFEILRLQLTVIIKVFLNSLKIGEIGKPIKFSVLTNIYPYLYSCIHYNSELLLFLITRF